MRMLGDIFTAINFKFDSIFLDLMTGHYAELIASTKMSERLSTRQYVRASTTRLVNGFTLYIGVRRLKAVWDIL